MYLIKKSELEPPENRTAKPEKNESGDICEPETSQRYAYAISFYPVTHRQNESRRIMAFLLKPQEHFRPLSQA